MKKAILTVGISGSGKSTWANEFILEKEDEGEWWIEINRDEIRKEVFAKNIGTKEPFTWNRWLRKWEKEVTEIWKERIEDLFTFSDDFDLDSLNGVIISDTNLNPKTRNWLLERFTRGGYEVEIKLFPIQYEEAVRRDRGRLESVGYSAIMEQWVKYNDQFGEKYVPNKFKPKAYIVDLDGTLAHKGDRDIFDWEKVEVDTLDEEVADVICGLVKLKDYKLIVLSGRDGVCKDLSEKWLNERGIYPDLFLTRTAGDMRKDYIVKKELFDTHIRDNYNVRMAFDDRPQVVRLWQSLGIKTFVLGNPWIEF